MTSAFKQLVEWYLGMQSAEPGEATAWTWRTSGWFSSAPTWLLLLAVAATIVGVVAVYRRDARSLSWKRRWTLVALRLVSLAVLLVLLLQVTLSIDRTSLPYIALMIDDSGSMEFQDDYSDTPDAEAAAELSGGKEAATRFALTQEMLTRNRGLLEQLAAKYRLRLYRFSDQAEPLRTDNPRDVGGLAKVIQELKATGQDTAPAAAMRQVLDEFRGDSPTAIVVLTDGVSTRGDKNRLQRAASAANRQAVPLYVVGMGSTKAASDLKLTDVNVDEVAIVDETILFTANLQSQGFENREVFLELRDATSDERLVGQTIKLTETSQPIELSYLPTVAGEFDYRIGVVPLDGEHITENNFEVRHVSVREGRIRVLLVDTLPRYEFRYVKHLLERSEGDSGSIELNTVLLDADPEWTALDTSAAALQGRVPASADQLNQYDVIILGDVDPNMLSPTTQEGLRDFVREKGGGVVLIAGPKHNPHAYRGTQIEPLIPIALDQVTAASFTQYSETGLRVEPTLAGRRGTSLFRFGDNESLIAKSIASLPKLHSAFRITEATAGTSVLASDAKTNAPIIVSRQHGAGRVVLHATDDLWKWRYRSGDDIYGRYWISLIRFLSRSSLLGRDNAAELMTNRETYDRGENVLFQLRFLDSRRQPTDGNVSISVDRRGGASSILQLEPSPEFPDVYAGALPSPDEGTYHAWVTKPVFEDAPPSTDFRVQQTGRELLVREMDLIGLRAAAKATRGRYYSLSTISRLVRDLPAGRAVAMESGKPIPLWSRPELLLLVVFLLALEWFLRKNARLV